MARFNFRQGLVRFQTDNANNPTFLQAVNGGSQIALVVSPDPTVITFAHGPTGNYTHQERQTIDPAWEGPFVNNVDYWLYWDLNLKTGERTFGHTLLQPVTAAFPPPGPQTDQHWFDLNTTTMKVYNGAVWVDKIRVFAGKYENGAVLQPYETGSQVGLNITVNSGFPLFDEDLNPVKKFNRLNQGEFITTETKLASQLARLANIRIESQFIIAEALEPIPAFSPLAYKGPRQVGLAKNTVVDFPAVGVSSEDMFAGEVRGFITQGYVENELWNWTDPSGTPVFYDSTGTLTTNVPQSWSIQQVATVVDPKVLYVDIKPLIIYG